MSKKQTAHPYHYSVDKNFLQKLIDPGLPVGLFLFFFFFYNSGVFAPREMIKTSGLMAITLLAFTLLIGPTCKIFPNLNFLKAHRKFWGILAFLAAFIHVFLVTSNYYHFNFSRFIDTSNSKYSVISSGLWSLIILFFVSLTSNKLALKILNPKVWKAVQLTSYIALILAIYHFYLLSLSNGTLDFKNQLREAVFLFAVFVFLIRIFVLILPKRKS